MEYIGQDEIKEDNLLFSGFLDVMRKFEDFEYMKHHDGKLYVQDLMIFIKENDIPVKYLIQLLPQFIISLYNKFSYQTKIDIDFD